MDKAEFRVKFRELLEEVGSGILATNGIDGSPSLRFVTPVPLDRDFSTIYCLSHPDSYKIKEIEKDPKVSWMFQAGKTRDIYNLKGECQVLDSPRLISEIMEQLGTRLTTFWKVNADPSEVIVLETVLKTAVVFNAASGEKSIIEF
jgi:general stress protein 26